MFICFRLAIAVLALGLLPGEGFGEFDRAANRIPGKPDTTDLLSLIDPSRDRVKGEVAIKAGALTIRSRLFFSATRLPYLASEQYDLELEVTRTAGRNGVGIILPLADRRQVALVLGGYPDKGGLDGLNYVDGGDLTENGTGRKSCMRNNEILKVTISVGPDQIGYRYRCGSSDIVARYAIATRLLSIDDRAGEVWQRGLALCQVRGESRFTKIDLKDYGHGRTVSAWAE